MSSSHRDSPSSSSRRSHRHNSHSSSSHHGHHRRTPWRKLRRAVKNTARYFDRRDIWIFVAAAVVALVIVILSFVAGSGGWDEVENWWKFKK